MSAAMTVAVAALRVVLPPLKGVRAHRSPPAQCAASCYTKLSIASFSSTPRAPQRLPVAAAAAKAVDRTRPRQQLVQVEPDGSDAWRLDPVVDALKEGAVGIIPTDSNLAFVCDLGSRSAVEKLLSIKRVRGSQRMSILCRSLQDVDTYTQGWPASRAPGQPDLFKLVKRVLPGPYTFILLAGKELPKALTNVDKGKSKKRHEVGVRLPDDPVAQAILQQLDRPLLCSTAAMDDEGSMAPDAAVLFDRYRPAGLDFVVDAGPRRADASSVIDCTGPEPVVVRQGKGDTSFLD